MRNLRRKPQRRMRNLLNNFMSRRESLNAPMSELNFSFFYSLFYMQRQVFVFAHNFKIVNRIIQFISIFMMNMFFARKRTIDLLRHYKSMFRNMASFIGHLVFWPIKIYIAIYYSLQIWISSCFGRSQLTTFSTSKRKSAFSFCLSIIIFMGNIMKNAAIRTFNFCMIDSIFNKKSIFKIRVFRAKFCESHFFRHDLYIPYPNAQIKVFIQGEY